MNNEIFRFAGLNSAILAVLMLLASPFQLHAQPPSIPDGGFTKERVLECRSPNAMDPAALAPIRNFWQQAWGRDLVVGEEGMSLQESQAAGIWEILVSNKTEDRYVDRGTFVEEARYAIDLGAEVVDQIYKEMAKASYLERYIMAGTVIGSTGTSIAVTAIITDLGNDNGNISRSFSILQSGTDSGESAIFAKTTAARLNVTAADTVDEGVTQDGSVFGKSGGACAMGCINTHVADVSRCNTVKNLCVAGAIAVAGLCAIACSGSTVAIAICLGLCDLALASALGFCAVNAQSCLNSAQSKRTSCLSGCTCPTFICEI